MANLGNRFRRGSGWLTATGSLALIAVIGCIYCIAAGAKTGDAASRAHVGPWDKDDIAPLTADMRSKLVARPKDVVEAVGNHADLDGIGIDLMCISSQARGDRSQDFTIAARSWTPDGGQYSGEDPVWNAGFAAELDRTPYDSEAPGTRFLTFRVTDSKAEAISVNGFVPGCARSGSEAQQVRGFAQCSGLGLLAGASFLYRSWTIVRGEQSDSYMMGIARGEWKRIGVLGGLPADVNKDVELKAACGTLLFHVPRMIAYSGPRYIPVVEITAVPSGEPRTQDFHLIVMDKDDKPISNEGKIPNRTACPVADWSKADHVVIEARPIRYVEFKDVHFYPDARKWPTAVWGDEGLAEVHEVEGVGRLEALMLRQRNTDPMAIATTYTPRGRLWLEYPDRNSVRGGGGENSRMEALIKLALPSVSTFDVDTTVYAAAGGEPGKGLGEEVVRWKTSGQNNIALAGFKAPYHGVFFTRPNSPYVQFRVRYLTGDWTSVGTVKPLPGPFVALKPGEHTRALNGFYDSTPAFSVQLSRNGSLSYEWRNPDGTFKQQDKVLEWQAHDGQSRLIAHLKSGGTAQLGYGSYSGDWAKAEFRLDPQSRPACASDQGIVLLSDVEEIEVQSRGFSEPTFFVAKLPVN